MADLAPSGHGHSHGPDRPHHQRAGRVALIVLACAAAVTIAAMALLWPRGDVGGDQPRDEAQATGDVVAVTTAPCPQSPDTPQVVPSGGPQECGTVTVKITSGPDEGKQIETDLPRGPGAPQISLGDRLTLVHTEGTASGVDYQILDHQRGTGLWVLGVAFALAVVAFGRLRGLAALGGLAITFGVLLFFIVPAILDGRSPLLVAVVGSAAIMLSVLYLTHGFTVPTTVAVLGTLTSLTLTGLLAAASTAALHLTGVGTEETNFLTITYSDVNMQGLLLAGILIGSLGVLDDVAVTQAATVSELAHANPALSAIRLYRSAARVGRAHITSVINTLVLAYAGASLPLLILLAAGNARLGEALTSQMLAQEIVRSVVGTMGLIAAVPITTALAAFAATRRPRQARRPKPAPPTAPTPRRRRGMDVTSDEWLAPADGAGDLRPGRHAKLAEDVGDVHGGGLR
ncbi:YibE/F family protein [Phytohabitans sp. ZYX-F-186]|uniref:YibE/F family protein n=1 Tax=Phytohabitans maris TaxID=3071409 RepID=A0ABU0ZH74_9ACTN|nr:YibE/F family protein [Phytohabitans sp. ZYX-F-186]MDQ7906406.1 YibE/F family protein [Phytohabitans sp. ZYX-F-186]